MWVCSASNKKGERINLRRQARKSQTSNLDKSMIVLGDHFGHKILSHLDHTLDVPLQIFKRGRGSKGKKKRKREKEEKTRLHDERKEKGRKGEREGKGGERGF